MEQLDKEKMSPISPVKMTVFFIPKLDTPNLLWVVYVIINERAIHLHTALGIAARQRRLKTSHALAKAGVITTSILM